MPDYLSNLKLVPSNAGSIKESSFVCVDGIQGDYLCRQATATDDYPIGVSQVGFDLPPNLIDTLTSGAATYTQVAGQPGEPIQIFHGGDVAPVRLGSGGATAGAEITNDTAGLGVMIAPFTTNRFKGGIALQAGSQGEIIEVFLDAGRS